jgi:hypothetical protein
LDIGVLGCYSAVITEAPYAVPVGQNAAGDYFRKISKVLSEALSLTSPMFGAFAPLVATVASLFKGGSKESAPHPKPAPKGKEPVKIRKDEAGGRKSLQIQRRGRN